MNPRIAGIAPSLIRSINSRKRPGDIDLGIGEPTLLPDLDPFAAALAWTEQNGSPYSPNAGFLELRHAIAVYLAGTGVELTAEQVCVTVGSEEALYLAIKTVLDPRRDEALIVEPCYLAYAKLCQLEGIRTRSVPLSPADGFRPRADAVLDAVRDESKLIVLNSPANPTGRVWPREELQALAEGLESMGRSDVFVLADEVYRELYFGDSPPESIARHHPNTLLAGSLSKSNALTGLRLGWLAGPAEIVASAIKVHQLVATAATTFSQRVAFEILSDPSRLSAHRDVYRKRRERLLEGARLCRLDVIPPEGAFYSFLKLPPSLEGDSLAAAERLLEEKRVVTVPGRAFGPSGEGWLRITWAGSPDLVEEGLTRIADWFADSG